MLTYYACLSQDITFQEKETAISRLAGGICYFHTFSKECVHLSVVLATVCWEQGKVHLKTCLLGSIKNSLLPFSKQQSPAVNWIIFVLWKYLNADQKVKKLMTSILAWHCKPWQSCTLYISDSYLSLQSWHLSLFVLTIVYQVLFLEFLISWSAPPI